MKLTILMTLYNGAPHLQETLKSVSEQTHKEFIFLILDNASTDSSREIIAASGDPRIHLVELPQNIGQVAALHKGISMIETPYVARIDADDIAMPERLEKQVAHLNTHLEVGICGTYAVAFQTDPDAPDHPPRETQWEYPVDAEDVKVKLLFECALAHPSVMMRMSVLRQYNLNYDPSVKHSYDWDLWQRAAVHTDIVNLPEYLLRYRLHGQSESNRTSTLQDGAAKRLDDFALARLGLEAHPLRRVHRDLCFETMKLEDRRIDFIEDVVKWFETLEKANSTRGIYDDKALHRFLKQRLHLVLTRNSKLGKPVREIFFREKIAQYIPKSWTIKFLGKQVLKK